jgi:Flp pilus assembly pilin Flp
MARSSDEVVMVTFASRARQIAVDATGESLMEYGLLVALISLVAMVAVDSVGTTLNTVFWNVIANGLANAAV